MVGEWERARGDPKLLFQEGQPLERAASPFSTSLSSRVRFVAMLLSKSINSLSLSRETQPCEQSRQRERQKGKRYQTCSMYECKAAQTRLDKELTESPREKGGLRWVFFFKPFA